MLSVSTSSTSFGTNQNRDAQNRDAQNRDAQNRDAQNRDAQNRDAQNRDRKGAGVRLVAFLFFLLACTAFAQLPDGPGKAETEKICSQCHELERSISLRQDRAGWQTTVDKMVGMGAKATDKEFQAVVEYLTKNYAAEEIPKLDVNQAEAIDFESGLTLKRSEAAAIIQYRKAHGNFKSIEDLKKVPGIDTAKIEAKKDRLLFK